MFALECPPMTHYGGLGTHLRELVSGLSQLGNKIDIFVPHVSADCIALDENTVLHLCAMAEFPPLRRQSRWRARNEAVYEATVREVKQGAVPDIVHCHEWFLFEAASAVRSLCNCAIAGTVHLAYCLLERWSESPITRAVREESRMCAEADGILTVSHSMKEALIRSYGLPDSRIQVVHNGITREPAKCMVLPVSGNEVRSNGKNIVYAGRVDPQKGLVELVYSAEIVLAARKDVTYQIVGCTGGCYERHLRDYCERSPVLRRHIVFKPQMKHEQLQELYESSDIVLVPSSYEPFGYAAVEAMLSEKCVIASDAGGLAEIIEDKVTGFLASMEYGQDGVCYCDPQDLARLQLMLLADDELRASVGRKARIAAIAKFGRERMCRETQHHYRRIIDEVTGNKASPATRSSTL